MLTTDNLEEVNFENKLADPNSGWGMDIQDNYHAMENGYKLYYTKYKVQSCTGEVIDVFEEVKKLNLEFTLLKQKQNDSIQRRVSVYKRKL